MLVLDDAGERKSPLALWRSYPIRGMLTDAFRELSTLW